MRPVQNFILFVSTTNLEQLKSKTLVGHRVVLHVFIDVTSLAREMIKVVGKIDRIDG